VTAVRLGRNRRGLAKPRESGDTSEPSVTNASEQKRYEISAGGVQAGLAAYVDTGTQRIFYRTEIYEMFGGRGLADILIAAALDDTRAAGKRVVAICPVVAAFVDKNEEYYEVLDPITPQAHAAVQDELP
jgi:uncharacterized protein